MNCEQQWKLDVVHFDSLVLHTLFLLLQNVTQVLFYNNIAANSPSRFDSDILDKRWQEGNRF